MNSQGPPPSRFTIGPLRGPDWAELARGVAQTLPHSVTALLGERFTIEWYRAIARQPYSRALAAHDPAGRLLGVAVGTLDNRRCFPDALAGQFLPLVLAALWGMRPGTLRWIAGRAVSRLSGRSEDLARRADDPRAESLFAWSTVAGSVLGLTDALRAAIEDFFLRHGRAGPYVVRTTDRNRAANRSILRSGGTLIRQVAFCGQTLNVYYRTPRRTAPRPPAAEPLR